MVEVPDRRRENSARTRDAIARAAFELALEQGFEETTVDQIASRAQVSPRTVYVRFATKDAIVFGAPGPGFAAWMADFEAQLDADTHADLLDRLVAFVLRRNEQTRAEGELALLRRRALLEDPYLRQRLRAQYDGIARAMSARGVAQRARRAGDGGARVFAAGVVVLLIEIAGESERPGAAESRERGLR